MVGKLMNTGNQTFIMDVLEDLELTIDFILRGENPNGVQEAVIESLLGDTIHSTAPPSCAHPIAPADLHHPPPYFLDESTDPWVEFHRPSPSEQDFGSVPVPFCPPANLFNVLPMTPCSSTTLVSDDAAEDLLFPAYSQPSLPPPNPVVWTDLCHQLLPPVLPPSSAVADLLVPYPLLPLPLPAPTVDDPYENYASTITVLSDQYNGLHPFPPPSSVMSQGSYFETLPCSLVVPNVQTHQCLLHPQFINTPTAMLPGNTIPILTPTGDTAYSSLSETMGGPAVYSAAPPSINQPIKPCKRKHTREHKDDGTPYIKKPPNAFMIFMKEQRPKMVEELQSRNNALVNTALGQRWASLTKMEKQRYFLEADSLKALHEQLYPDWSPRDNYGKKRKRERRRSSFRDQ